MKPHTPYVYRITDRENGKRYIGSRYAKGCTPADLGVTYFTSRPEVTTLFRENPERFEKQIIVTGTAEYVINVEKALIDMYDAVLSDEFYNRTSGKAIHPDDIARGCKNGGLAMAERTSHRMRTNHPMRNPVNIKNQSERMKNNNPGKTESGRKAMSVAAKGKPKSSLHKERIKNSGCGQKGAALNFMTLWKCNDCGLTTRVGPMTCHQKASGHFGKSQLNKE